MRRRFIILLVAFGILMALATPSARHFMAGKVSRSLTWRREYLERSVYAPHRCARWVGSVYLRGAHFFNFGSYANMTKHENDSKSRREQRRKNEQKEREKWMIEADEDEEREYLKHHRHRKRGMTE